MPSNQSLILVIHCMDYHHFTGRPEGKCLPQAISSIYHLLVDFCVSFQNVLQTAKNTECKLTKNCLVDSILFSMYACLGGFMRRFLHHSKHVMHQHPRLSSVRSLTSGSRTLCPERVLLVSWSPKCFLDTVPATTSPFLNTSSRRPDKFRTRLPEYFLSYS